MRLILEGTMDQIRGACAVVAKHRDGTKQVRARALKNEKNSREAKLMRAAYLMVKDDPGQRVLANAFASAIYGERETSLIDAAMALTARSKRRGVGR